MKDTNKNPKRIYDTSSITMELERPLLEAKLQNMEEDNQEYNNCLLYTSDAADE